MTTEQPASDTTKQVPTRQDGVVIAYKGFDENLKCRDFQYEIGKTYEIDGKIKACERGFHACENPLDVWGYYTVVGSRYAKVTLAGEIDRGGNDTKIAAARITIDAEIALPNIVNAAVKYMIDGVKSVFEKPDTEDEDSDRDGAQIGSSGDGARIGSSGYGAQIGSSGNDAQIGSSGDGARIEVTGKDAVVAAAGGVRSFVLGEGGCIAIPHHDGTRMRFLVAYAGENVEAGKRYEVVDGAFKVID